MQLPIVNVAPLVKEHSEIFRCVFANRNQFRHFENYLTGLMVLDNKSMANIARCILDSADKTNVSRYLSEAPWRAASTQRPAHQLHAVRDGPTTNVQNRTQCLGHRRHAL